MKPSILVLFFDPGISEATKFNRKTAQDVNNALLNKGYSVQLVEVNRANWRQALKLPGNIVFNFVEDDPYVLYRKVANNLKKMGRIQFAVNMNRFKLTVNKHIIRKTLRKGGVPIPRFSTNSHNHDLRFPLIVKPISHHSSIGINQHSVVENQQQLLRRVKKVNEHFGPAVIEEYIAGREICVTVLGNKHPFTLPYCEYVFNGPCNKWKIFSYKSKWAFLAGEDSCEIGRDVLCPAPLPQTLKNKIEEGILKAYKVLGFFDMARIDFRLTDSGDFYIFDANNSPSISNINWFDAYAMGWSYEDYIEVLVGICSERL